MGYTSLHVHSVGSLLDGLSRVEDIVDKSIEYNQKAACITDHGQMYMIADLFKYAQSKGQRAIAGFEAYVAKDRLIKEKNDVRHHFILLAKNLEGYKHLTRICSYGNIDGFYYRPRIDNKLMEEIGTDNLIASSACIAGIIPFYLLKDNIEEAEKWCKYYARLFKNNFYLEIQPLADPDQVKVNKGLIELSKKLGLPLVATTDSHYTNKEDAKAHEMLLAIQTKADWDDPNRWKFKGDTFYLMNEEEIKAAFNRNGHEELDRNAVLEAINNTDIIAEQCNLEFNFGTHYLPKINAPKDDLEYQKQVEKAKKRDKDFVDDDSSYLRYLCLKGLKKKVPEVIDNKEIRQKYLDRLNYELDVIKNMGFSSYFLIVADFINFALNNNIAVGPGRGCLIKDSKVNIDGKIKLIQDILIDDYVIGHDEKKHKVFNTVSYNISEELISIDTEDNKNLSLTKDHKIYAIKKEDFENGIRVPKWYTADELDEGDYIAEL